MRPLPLALWALVVLASPALAQDRLPSPPPAATAAETTGAGPADEAPARWQREVERHNDRMLAIARGGRPPYLHAPAARRPAARERW